MIIHISSNAQKSLQTWHLTLSKITSFNPVQNILPSFLCPVVGCWCKVEESNDLWPCILLLKKTQIAWVSRATDFQKMRPIGIFSIYLPTQGSSWEIDTHSQDVSEPKVGTLCRVDRRPDANKRHCIRTSSIHETSIQTHHQYMQQWVWCTTMYLNVSFHNL